MEYDDRSIPCILTCVRRTRDRVTRILPKVFDAAACAFAVLIMACLVPGLTGSDHWRVELLVHWEPWLGAVLFLPLPWLLWRRRWILTVLILLFVPALLSIYEDVREKWGSSRGQAEFEREPAG